MKDDVLFVDVCYKKSLDWLFPDVYHISFIWANISTGPQKSCTNTNIRVLYHGLVFSVKLQLRNSVVKNLCFLRPKVVLY